MNGENCQHRCDSNGFVRQPATIKTATSNHLTMIFHRLALTLFVVFYLNYANASSDKFHEELFIKPLNSGHVYTYFQFTTQWLLQSNDSCKFDVNKIDFNCI